MLMVTPGVQSLWAGAVLFDLDGTLVDSGDAVDRAWHRWCDTYAVEFGAIDDLRHGRTAIDLIRLIRPTWSAAHSTAAAREQLRLQEDDPDPGLAMPGAADLLTGLPLDSWAVVTACSRRLAEHRLTAAGLPLPGTVVCADDVTRGKPDPESYLLAAERMGVPPQDCLVIEDAPAGVQAGLAAGCRVIAVTSTHAASALMTATAVVGGLTDIGITQV